MGLFLLISLLLGAEPSMADCTFTQTTPSIPWGNGRITELGTINFSSSCNLNSWQITLYDELWGEHGTNSGSGSSMSITPPGSGSYRLGVSSDPGVSGPDEIRVGTKPTGTATVTTESCVYDTYHKIYTGLTVASGMSNIEGYDVYYTYELANPADSDKFHFGAIGLGTDAAFNATSPGDYSVKVFGWAGPWSIPVPPATFTVKAKLPDCDPFFPGTITPRIFQVVENPQLNPPPPGEQPDDVVDLVAGKNADVIVKAIYNHLSTPVANFDIRGSTIELAGISFGVEGSTTNGQGEATFHIDPVPNVSGKFDLKIILKSEQNLPLGEKTVQVHIRKTKPIKLGFVPVSGCEVVDQCFLGATFSQANHLATIAGPLTRVMYPVADSEFKSSDVVAPQAIGTIYQYDLPENPTPEEIKNAKERARQRDREKLAKVVFKSKVNTGEITHVIGVYNHSYFADYYGDSNVVGEANGGIPGVQVIYQDPLGVPHELGHAFWFNAHSGTNQSVIGFNNYSGTNLNFVRGLLVDQFALMHPSPPVGNYLGYWPTESEYYQIFRENLKKGAASLVDTGPKIRVSGSISAIGEFKNTSTYFLNKGEITEESPDGNFEIEVKDAERNHLFSRRFKSSTGAHFGDEFLAFNIVVPANAVFIDIYKDEIGFRQAVGGVVVPADIISEELFYLPVSAFKESPSLGRKQLNELVAGFRQDIIEGKLSSARTSLTSRIKPALEHLLTDDFLKSTMLDSDREILLDVSSTSYIRMLSLDSMPDPVNRFVRIDLLADPVLNEVSKIKVVALRGPVNSDQKFVHRAYFDGIEVNLKQAGNRFLAESPRLSAGEHAWTVVSYLADKRLENSLSGSILKYQDKKTVLERSLEEELNLEKRQQLLAQIQDLDRQILRARMQRDSNRRAIGQTVGINFVVEAE